MISEKMEKFLNDQMTKEFYSAYLYLSIEAYFASLNLNGFSNWFHVQSQEERDHAMLFYQYINKVGGRVRLGQLEAPKWEFVSIQEALKLTYEHEQFVTDSIYRIVDLAIEEKDHKTNTFLQWFVNEQVEEEQNADNNIKRYNLVGDDGRGLLMMDAELAARVYVPAAVSTAQV